MSIHRQTRFHLTLATAYSLFCLIPAGHASPTTPNLSLGSRFPTVSVTTSSSDEAAPRLSQSPAVALVEDFSAAGFWRRAALPATRYFFRQVDTKFAKIVPKPLTPWVARHGLTAQEYQAEFDRWTRQGYRLIDVSSYDHQGTARYAAIWEKSPGPEWHSRHGLTGDEYQQEFDAQLARGFRPVLVNGYTLNGTDRYAAIWVRDSGVEWAARHGITSAEYQSEFDEKLAQGFRLVHISGYGVEGHPRYAAIWEKSTGPEWTARHGMSAEQFQAEFEALASAGYRLKRVSGFFAGGAEQYAAIWEKGGSDPWIAAHGLDPRRYQLQFDDYRYQGYRPLAVSGYSDGGARIRFAAVWRNEAFSSRELSHIDQIAEEARQKWSLPALSLAIAKEGRLVFAKAYGTSDFDGKEPVHASSLFRIASVSKPVTSAAILKLMEEGKLSLSSPVFGRDGILGNRYNLPLLRPEAVSPDLDQITVKHLLQHTAGGWPNDEDDPVFEREHDRDRNSMILRTLYNRPLDHTPGTHFAYSNFGYVLLGRVIEAVSGADYEGWVRENVLAPLGVQNMVIAGNTLAERRPEEVVYFDAEGDRPYELNFNRMDSAGGWLASAIDLVRFGVAVDGLPNKPDLFRNNDTLSLMVTPWQNEAGYALGWESIIDSWWHTGSLPGTNSFLMRSMTNGYVFAAVTNSRQYAPELEGVVWDIVFTLDRIGGWPDHDLF